MEGTILVVVKTPKNEIDFCWNNFGYGLFVLFFILFSKTCNYIKSIYFLLQLILISSKIMKYDINTIKIFLKFLLELLIWSVGLIWSHWIHIFSKIVLDQRVINLLTIFFFIFFRKEKRKKKKEKRKKIISKFVWEKIKQKKKIHFFPICLFHIQPYLHIQFIYMISTQNNMHLCLLFISLYLYNGGVL